MLNQLLAIRKGANNNSNRVFTHAYQQLQKPALLTGILKTYQARDEEGETLPGEEQKVQVIADKVLHEATAAFRRMFQINGEIDATNCVARADVVIDGNVLLANAPVTHLIWLEKQLTDFRTFIARLPVLPSDRDWTESFNVAGTWQTPPIKTVRSKKVPRNHVKAISTEKHPAQVEVYYEDVVVGDWTTVIRCGAMREADVAVLLSRVDTVAQAVKKAREFANTTEVVKLDSTVLLDYIVQSTKTPR